MTLHRPFLLALIGMAVMTVPVGAQAPSPTIDALERAAAADPENLRVAADYRQLVIASGRFDRSIDFLDKLADRKGSGPNVKISLALAYVDKVPTSGDWSRLYLGRDGIRALDQSIKQRPSVLAYYVRGLIKLYYNKFIFNQLRGGIADLRTALALAGADTPPALVSRIYIALGDGLWRLDEKLDREKALEIWKAGAARFPTDPALHTRISADAAIVSDVVSATLYAGARVDTSLRDVVP